MLKPLTVWITTNCGEMRIPDHLTCLLRNLYAGQEAIDSDMEQWTGSKLGKENEKAIHGSPANLTSMQSILREMPSWMTHRLESKLPGEISTTSDMQIISL